MTSQTEAETEDNEVIVSRSSGKSIIQTVPWSEVPGTFLWSFYSIKYTFYLLGSKPIYYMAVNVNFSALFTASAYDV